MCAYLVILVLASGSQAQIAHDALLYTVCVSVSWLLMSTRLVFPGSTRLLSDMGGLGLGLGLNLTPDPIGRNTSINKVNVSGCLGDDQES